MALNTQGTIISISSDGTTYTEIGCITSVSIEQAERAQIDVTCFDSTSKEYKMGLKDAASVSLSLNYEPNSEGQVLLEESYASDNTYSFKIEYNDAPAGGTPTPKEFDGYVMSLVETGELDGVFTEDVTIQVSGNITKTPAAPAP